MISVREAVANALAYVEEFGDLLPRGGVRLEETDFDDQNNEWNITISFPQDLALTMRSYKQFKIDASTGQVKSMRNRSLAAL